MKKVLLIILVFTLVLILVGCSRNDFEAYIKAVKKTSEITRGTSKTDVQIDTEFKYNSPDTFEKELYSLLNNVKFSINTKFDQEIKKIMSEMYVNIGGIGQDINFYLVDDKQYIEYLSAMTVDKKYIELTGSSKSEATERLTSLISKNTLLMIKDKWTDMLNEENVFRGEKVLVSTDEGEVKATEYTIEINDEQFKELAEFVLDTSLANGDINKLFLGSGNEEEKGKRKFDVNDLYYIVPKAKNILNEASNIKLYYKAFVDMDGYIVEENIGFNLESDDKNESYGIKRIDVQSSTKTFNIEKEQSFDFETPTSENTVKIEDVDFQKIFTPIQGR